MVIDLLSFSINSFQSYNYLFIFIFMFIEGPIITLIASFFASFDVFNIFIIFILSILGSVLPDFLFFSIGHYARKNSLEKFIYRLGITKDQIHYLEKNLKKHTKEAIVFIKITPLIPVPGILLAGFLRIPYKKFFTISIIVDLMATLLYTIMGYGAGLIGINLVRFFRLEKYIFPILLIVLILVFFAVKKLYRFIIKYVKSLN